jgi:hypothetical protein
LPGLASPLGGEFMLDELQMEIERRNAVESGERAANR